MCMGNRLWPWKQCVRTRCYCCSYSSSCSSSCPRHHEPSTAHTSFHVGSPHIPAGRIPGTMSFLATVLSLSDTMASDLIVSSMHNSAAFLKMAYVFSGRHPKQPFRTDVCSSSSSPVKANPPASTSLHVSAEKLNVTQSEWSASAFLVNQREALG